MSSNQTTNATPSSLNAYDNSKQVNINSDSYPGGFKGFGYLMRRKEQGYKQQSHHRNSLLDNTSRLVYSVFLLFAITLFSGSIAYAEPNQGTILEGQNAPEIRIMSAISKFTGTKQVAFAFTVLAPQWLHANRVEIAVGSIGNSDDTTAFVSAGPLWRWNILSPKTFFELGFSPTVLADTEFGTRDIGGHLHFSSSASIGHKFGKHKKSNVALRIQHISNGGLSSTNPGLDSVGLSFTFVL